MKKRTGEPWMPAPEYGHSLPAFTVNLLVRNVTRSVEFYANVLQGEVLYSDADFAALRIAGVDLMLHADHTYDDHPWYGRLVADEARGLGAELRLFGPDPDGVLARAIEAGAPIVRPITVRGHGWREVMVQDPDGYVWAVGVAV